MPIFDYQCQCGHIWEVFVLRNEDTPIVCPHCGESENIVKLTGLSSFKLTGTGWYETDFKDSK